jgi:hypothetical protein
MNVPLPVSFSPSCIVSHEVVWSQSDSDGGGSSLIDKLTAVPAWKVRRTQNRTNRGSANRQPKPPDWTT